MHFIDEFERAGLLGGNIDKLDFAARRILQATKHCRIALLHVGGVLCAHLFRADERAFHIDTHQRGSIGGINMLGGAFHNARELFFGERHGRAAPCGYAAAGLVACNGVDRLMRAVAEIMPHRAMRMHVDQARNGEQPLGVDDLARLVAGRNDAVAFDEDIVFNEFAVLENFRTSNFQHAALPFVISRETLPRFDSEPGGAVPRGRCSDTHARHRRLGETSCERLRRSTTPQRQPHKVNATTAPMAKHQKRPQIVPFSPHSAA